MNSMHIQNIVKKITSLVTIFLIIAFSTFANFTYATITPVPGIPVMVVSDENTDTKDGNIYEQIIALFMGINYGSMDSITWHTINMEVIMDAIKIIVDINKGREIIGFKVTKGNSLVESGDWQDIARQEADTYFLTQVKFFTAHGSELEGDRSMFVGFEGFIKNEAATLAQKNKKSEFDNLVCPISTAEIEAYQESGGTEIETLFKIMENPTCNPYGAANKLASIHASINQKNKINAQVDVIAGGGVRTKSTCNKFITEIDDIEMRLTVTAPYGNLCLAKKSITPAGTVKDTLSDAKNTMALQDRYSQADEIGENKGVLALLYKEFFNRVLGSITDIIDDSSGTGLANKIDEMKTKARNKQSEQQDKREGENNKKNQKNNNQNNQNTPPANPNFP